ncbi:MAG TPA: nitronate monooxygenase [Polyangia bacterium]|nr:nitronate monooxygenase [Polyangia bacterium]
MTGDRSPLARAGAFCDRFALRRPILLAPMAGACPPSLSIAVARAGGMGAAGVLLLAPDAITAWMRAFRAGSDGPAQLNLWVPDPPPPRDPDHERRVREFLGGWGPPVAADAGDASPPDFAAQCQAVLDAAPAAVSSIMGVFPAPFVAQLKARGIAWFAVATTVGEAVVARDAGADVIVAQGSEAGGHRGAFDPALAERRLVGTFALVPAVADAVDVPVVATGGIADGRGVAAALALGASAVQVGSAFLRCPEAQLPPAWARALARARPEDTLLTRAFSGRPGRSLATRYATAAAAPGAPPPAPYPVQRGLTAAMRAQAQKDDDLDRMQAWAGQSAALAPALPAADLVDRLWHDARDLLGSR